MKKFNNIEEAVKTVKDLADEWNDVTTITNIQTSNGMINGGYFVDMVANIVSFNFLKQLANATGDFNPVVTPLDNECMQIEIYIIINDSGE